MVRLSAYEQLKWWKGPRVTHKKEVADVNEGRDKWVKVARFGKGGKGGDEDKWMPHIKGIILFGPSHLLLYLNDLLIYKEKQGIHIIRSILPICKYQQLILKIFHKNSDLKEGKCELGLTHRFLFGVLWSHPVRCTQENASRHSVESKTKSFSRIKADLRQKIKIKFMKLCTWFKYLYSAIYFECHRMPTTNSRIIIPKIFGREITRLRKLRLFFPKTAWLYYIIF